MNKKQWIVHYAKNADSLNTIDLYSDKFVNAYINEFNPNVVYYEYGTPYVPELKKLLVELYKEGLLNRYRNYVPHYCKNDGYPKWFYVYFYDKGV